MPRLILFSNDKGLCFLARWLNAFLIIKRPMETNYFPVWIHKINYLLYLLVFLEINDQNRLSKVKHVTLQICGNWTETILAPSQTRYDRKRSITRYFAYLSKAQMQLWGKADLCCSHSTGARGVNTFLPIITHSLLYPHMEGMGKAGFYWTPWDSFVKHPDLTSKDVLFILSTTEDYSYYHHWSASQKEDLSGVVQCSLNKAI